MGIRNVYNTRNGKVYVNMKIPKKEWEQCPCCPNQGCYEITVTGYGHACGGDERLCQTMCPIPDPELDQEQCEFCWTNSKSVFYQVNKLWEKENE